MSIYDIVRFSFRSSRIERYRQYFWDILVNSLAASYVCPLKLRSILFRSLGMRIGSDSAIHAKCYFGSNRLAIGSNSYINRECLLDNHYGLVQIGEKCAIGYRVTFITSNHRMSDAERRAGELEVRQIQVDDGVWIGANCVILPGVHIGAGVVLAANSVINKDCDPHCLYAGIPAQRIRALTDKVRETDR